MAITTIDTRPLDSVTALKAIRIINENAMDKTGANTIAGVQTFSDTTASTSTTTGALKVAGGIGCAKDVYAVNVAATTAFKVGANQVVGAKQTGVQAMTNLTAVSNWNADTVTTAELADIVGLLITKLRTHGLIGD